MLFSKEMNKLISNECQTYTIKKNWRSKNFSEKYISRKENLKKCTSLEEQKDTRHIQGNVYFGIIIVYKTVSQITFSLAYRKNGTRDHERTKDTGSYEDPGP